MQKVDESDPNDGNDVFNIDKFQDKLYSIKPDDD